MTSEYIADLSLDDSIVLRNEDITRIVNAAVTDIMGRNSFTLHDHPCGPYALTLSVAENRLLITIRTVEKAEISVIPVPLLPFRRIIKDYELVCDSYHNAIEHAHDPSKIEAIDMGRRGLHNEGADLLIDFIDATAEMDYDTARRFFTLVYVLHIKG